MLLALHDKIRQSGLLWINLPDNALDEKHSPFWCSAFSLIFVILYWRQQIMYANVRNTSFLPYLQQKPGRNISESFSHSILISPEKGTKLVRRICFSAIKSLSHRTRFGSLVEVHQGNHLKHGWCISPNTSCSQHKAFCDYMTFTQLSWVSAAAVRHRQAAVLMAPLTSRLIRSSSPRIQKSARLFVFRQLGHAVVLCLLVSFAFSRILGAGFAGSSWSQRAASGVSVPPLVLLSVREQSRSSASDSSGQLQNLQHTNATNLPEVSPFLFAFLAVVRLWYFASYLSHSPSVSAPLAPPTSIKFHLLCASCSYVVVLLYGFASYSVIKAPLCAQPRTAVFWVKGVPVGAPGPSQRGFGLCGYVIMRISLVSICLCCCFLVLIWVGCFRLKGEETEPELEGGFFPRRPYLPVLL